MQDPAAVPVEELLAHRSWVRALARTLVAEGEADDLEQDTWLAALRRPPRGGGSLRSWLGATTRNQAASRGRSRARRERREERVAERDARDAASVDVAEVLDRGALQKRVVELVWELDPALREVVVLRFFEDLAPRAIAEALELPYETVRTRLRRGLERLRARMERAYGTDWRQRCIGLLGLESTRRSIPWLLIGGWSMPWFGKALVSVAVAAALLVGFWPESAPHAPAANDADAFATAPSVQEVAELAEADAALAQRTPASVPIEPEREARWTLRFVDADDGRSLAAAVRPREVEQERAPATPGSVAPESWRAAARASDAAGVLRLSVPAESSQEYTVRVDEPGYPQDTLLVLEARPAGSASERIVAFSARADLVFRGVVRRSEDDGAIEGARIRSLEGRSFEATAASGPSGAFSLGVRSWREPLLWIDAPGRSLALVPAQEGLTREPLVVRLRRSAALRVSVVDPAGSLPPDAEIVVAAFPSTLVQPAGSAPFLRSDPNWVLPAERGEQSFEDLPSEVPLSVYVRRGESILHTHPDELVLAANTSDELELRLGAPLALAGIVLDESGEPVAGAVVDLFQPNGPSELFTSSFRRERTASTGTFHFDAAGAGAWRLKVVVPASREARHFAPEVRELALAAEGPREPLRVILREGVFVEGRVLGPEGRPVHGAQVHADQDRGLGTEADTWTHADGTFEIGPLVAGAFRLSASADLEGGAARAFVESTTDAGPVELQLSSGRALEVRILHADGALVARASLLSHWRERQHFTQRELRAGKLEEGSVRFDGLPDGTFDLVATTPDGYYAERLGLAVDAETADTIVELVLQPGATLVVPPADVEGRVKLEVRRGGLPLLAPWLDGRGEARVTVPPGALELLLRLPDGTERRASVTVGVREITRVSRLD